MAKPVSPSPDEAAWALLKETTDDAALKRFTTQYPDSALRKDAEARIAALAAAQAAKPVPPRPDEVTWALLKETTDEGALKRFTAQYPKSALRKDAETRIAALEAAQAAKPVPPGPDEVTWAMLKETTDEAALKRFTSQYPKSPLRKEAEGRIAALAAAQAAKPAPPSSSAVTTSPVAALTSRAPPSDMLLVSLTMGTKSARPGMYAVPAAHGPSIAATWGTTPLICTCSKNSAPLPANVLPAAS